MDIKELCSLAPESFVPQNNDQDISIMGPLFLQFENESNAFRQYSAEQCIGIHNLLNTNTSYFYIYAQDEHWLKQGPEYQTLARWRYTNDERHDAFCFWLQGHKKHVEEIEQINQKFADIQAKVDSLDRVFSTELYKHHTGATYQLLLVGNTTATKPGYPVSAAYMNIHTREVFIRPLDDFQAKTQRI